MEDIYPILAKHFSKEASPDEEKIVAEFKDSSPKEYTLLRELWNRNNIEVHDFDSQKAWEAFVSKRAKRPTRTIPIFGNIRNIAAAVAFLILGTVAVYYFAEVLPKSNMVFVENTNANILEELLADGSVVWLNKGASIQYPKKFKTATRMVSLTGEAFFEVTEDSDHPFIVTADYSTITVLGTSFNIDTNDERTMISVQTGKVEVASKSSNDKVVLLHGQSALVTKNKLFRRDVVNPNYLSWKTGAFEFDDLPIAQVVDQLNTYYRDSLAMNSNQIYNCNLSAKFNKTPLDEIVQIIEVTCGLSIKKAGDRYVLEE